jgi:adenylate cyclase
MRLIRSYQSAFVALFLVLLIITVTSVASNAYRRASQVSLDLSADIMAEMSARLVERTVDIFADAGGYLDADALVMRGEDLVVNRNELDWLFWTQLSRSPQLRSVYAADTDGSFLLVGKQPRIMTRLIDRAGTVPTELTVYRNEQFEPIAHITGDVSFDPRARDWFRGAAEQPGAIYQTPIYRFENDGMLGVTIARAVLDDGGGLRAVLGIDIALQDLSGFLSDLTLAEGSVPLIIDGSGQLVAHPFALEFRAWTDADADALPHVGDLKADWLSDAYRGLRDGSALMRSNGTVDYALTKTDGATYITHQQPFPPQLGADWTLFIVVPEATLLASAQRLLSESAVISLIILCVAMFAVWLLARQLFIPLRLLEHNTRRIKALQLDDVRPVRSGFREIQALDQALWSMKGGLQRLEKFVPADVARQLIASGDEIKLGGELHDLSLLCGGVGGLSKLCQQLPPERVTRALAAQFDSFSQVVLELNGTIDNYLGESMMAFWGAPVPSENGTERACLAALACRRLEADLHAHWRETDGAPPYNLYSVHCGQTIVGAIGSSQRMSYTALGDNVALGVQLRRLNLRYGTRILVSDAARQQVAEHFWFRRVDLLPLDAGSAWLPVFELIDERRNALAPAQIAFIERYEAALAALQAARWEEAKALFESLAEAYPDDTSVALMLARCQRRGREICSPVECMKLGFTAGGTPPLHDAEA